ncbi:hypothetical protein MNBD_DELTA04-1821 [hydrothermal vent metagenome]|uniref:Polyprenyl synthetase family protein n=1 Tax=hydrothermal vent metagenome TaxID=652676 RepID=A0A3B0VIN0_9ZZZZ
MTTIKPAEPSALRTFVRRQAAVIETAMRRDLAGALTDNDPLLAEVLNYALFGGGKRIRPLLAVLSSRVCGANGEEIYRLAAAFEYLHVATLVHDDVIDHARDRRGRESVARRYGMAAAILAGDWLHARSMYLIGRFAGSRGLDVFCSSTTGMVDGEFLQLRHVADAGMTEQQYFAVIHRKTGLLIAATCEIGALHAGAGPEQQAALATYGRKLGAAFQVIDDLLDYLGDAASTGKKTGNDFIEGKVTLPLIHTLAAAEPAAKKRLHDLLRGERTAPGALAVVHRMIEDCHGFESARQTAERLVAEAIDALVPFTETAEAESFSMLGGLALYVLARDR